MEREGSKRTYYPLYLDLYGKRCIVVGGGQIAERKTRGLIEGGADRVTIISPIVTPGLAKMAELGSIRWERREYQEKDVTGATLVFAATDSRTVNEKIVRDGRAAGALLNQADEAADGDFIVPAAVRRGAMLLSVSTGGMSPTLAMRIRGELERRYGEPYAWWIERLGELRKIVLKEEGIAQQAKRDMLRGASDEAVLDLQGERRSPQREEETIEAWMSRLARQACHDGGLDGT
ncbi:bifunctional precorrin-2 dehydrogenase/sirohydrochlorin ferrochelatase [Paenibacillus aurantiacus]|uniref:precorrin-2 dehydrogenase n=1 Tax=Paenibacillus aurantiacus TaxID=1936118 RepID=A0ABV5KPV0_9BACL